MQHAVHRWEDLERFFPLTPEERLGCLQTQGLFRLRVPPYILSLIDAKHPHCPIRRQAIPLPQEATFSPGELEDPLGEEAHRPVEAVVHRYADRALLLCTDVCPMYCRHCTRRRITRGGHPLGEKAREAAVDYIAATPGIREVLLSGGEPALLSDEALEALLKRLRAIGHVEVIRLGTRVPVTLPMRVTPAFARLLRRHAPVFVVTHFNHPREVTPAAARACGLLVDAGVPVENQAVLLRGINSSARILEALFVACLRMRVRPYYLHQLDVAQGIAHMRTPLGFGVEVLRELTGRVSGLALPAFAVDLPGGGGKVRLGPEAIVSQEAGYTVLQTPEGHHHVYPEPPEEDCHCPYVPFE
jgi:lysine 2,3-aminomutase